MLLFGADGGGVAVSCCDNGVVGEGEQLGLDAVDEPVEIAAGQIGASDAAFEQRVARDHGCAVGHIERDTSGGVSWRGKHDDFLVAEHQFVAVFQGLVDADGRHLNLEPEEFRLHGQGIFDKENNKKGDHIVTVFIKMPKNLSLQEKELYNKLAKLRDFNPREE